jgi:hypothetical protein
LSDYIFLATFPSLPTRLSQPARIHLNHRPRIRPLCKKYIVQHTKQRNTARHDAGPIHALESGRGLRGPEAEKDDETEIANGKDVVGDAEGTFETPGAPCQTNATIVVVVAVGKS